MQSEPGGDRAVDHLVGMNGLVKKEPGSDGKSEVEWAANDELRHRGDSWSEERDQEGEKMNTQREPGKGG